MSLIIKTIEFKNLLLYQPPAVSTTKFNETMNYSKTHLYVISLYISVKSLSPHFVAPTCNDFTPTGLPCDKLNSPCEMAKPCKNNGFCTDNNTIPAGYSCSCLPDFNGTQCQYDHRPCKPDTCWNNGILLHFLTSIIKVYLFLFQEHVN